MARPSGSAPPALPRPAEEADDEARRLFESAMRGVRRLAPGPVRIRPPSAEPSPAATRAPGPPPGLARQEAAPQARLLAAGPGPQADGYGFLAPGEPRARLKELRDAGQAPQATLDLHGMKSDAARRALDGFVRRCHGEGRRLCLVVHGRGLRSGDAGPVLRDLVVAELTAGPLAALVLALTSAPPRLGGAGAALLRLRRR